MHDYHQGKLPIIFHDMFALVSGRHHYNTRLASKSSYCIPLIRTNYGKFSLRFQGPKIWNAIDECIKKSSKFSFKRNFKNNLIALYELDP